MGNVPAVEHINGEKSVNYSNVRPPIGGLFMRSNIHFHHSKLKTAFMLFRNSTGLISFNSGENIANTMSHSLLSNTAAKQPQNVPCNIGRNR